MDVHPGATNIVSTSSPRSVSSNLQNHFGQIYPALFFYCRLLSDDICLAALMRLLARDYCYIITADRKYTTGNAAT